MGRRGDQERPRSARAAFEERLDHAPEVLAHRLEARLLRGVLVTIVPTVLAAVGLAFGAGRLA